MQISSIYQALKAVSILVIVLGAASIAYAAFIGVKYWSGIGV